MTWVLPGVPRGPSDVCSHISSETGRERILERPLVAPDVDDLIQIAVVVARPDLDDHAALLALGRLEERQEHALAGVGEEVCRPALTRLPELLEVHRDVAVGIAGRPGHDRHVDVERGDTDAGGDGVGVLGVGDALAGGADASGGRVMRGVAVGVAVGLGLAVALAEGWVSAATGVVYESRPAARRVTPDAVSSAGRIRVRSRSAAIRTAMLAGF